MVRKKMYTRIQRFKKNGKSKTEIARILNIDPATVRKYYHMSPAEYQNYHQDCLKRKKLFEEYFQDIIDIYELNEKKELNMAAVYDYLEEKYGTLAGNEQTLRNYIKYLLQSGELELSKGKRIYTKVAELPYWKQLQIDFGEYKTKSGLKLYIFAAVLSASRYKCIALQRRPFQTIDVIEHLLDSFDYFGGIPEELVIDQDLILVVSENHGDIIYTKMFRTFIEEMDLSMFVCRKADPESKGKIENVIKYVKYNFLSVRDFTNCETAQECLKSWLKRRANGKISQATKRIPANDIKKERPHLRPLLNSLFRKTSLLGRDLRTVSDKGFITVESNMYSVPTQYCNQTVEIYKTSTELFIYKEGTSVEIAHHSLSLENGVKIFEKGHFRSNSLPLNELHEQVLQMFPFPSWKTFVKQNKKAFSRYSRDQFLEAKKLFAEKGDTSILEDAVDFCLTNNTVSMRELFDTYSHLLQEHTEQQHTIQEAFSSIFSKPVQSPHVTKRAICEYESAIGSPKGGTL